jgi:phosphotransferase system enzyme I (PtsI)
VSDGVAHAVVHVLKDHFDEPDEDEIKPEMVVHEMERLHTALDTTRREIEELQRAMGAEEGNTESEIFETHLLILLDSSILKMVEKRVRENLVCVDAVYYRLMTQHMEKLRGLQDAYLRERFLDIKDVTQRVMRHLRGELLETPMFDEPVIIVAHDLTPSDTVMLDRRKVLGFAVEAGSAVSHAAIIAKSLGIPAVVKLHGICDSLHSGDSVLLDGEGGELILNPTADTLKRYRTREEQAEKREDVFQLDRHERRGDALRQHDLRGRERRVPGGGGIDQGQRRGGGGAFPHGVSAPGESKRQRRHAGGSYGSVVKARWRPARVVFRTLDLGGDKVDERLAAGAGAESLSWAGAASACLWDESILFKRQLRALLRAASARTRGHHVSNGFRDRRDPDRQGRAG